MWRIRSLELKRERVFDDWERNIRQPPLVRCEILVSQNFVCIKLSRSTRFLDHKNCLF